MPCYKDKNGKWIAKFQYTDWQGVRRTKFKRGFDKKKDAQEYERTFTAEPELTLGLLFDRFLEAKDGELKENTVSGYRVLKNKLPALSNKNVASITPMDILNLRSVLSKTNSPATVNQYMSRLSNVFTFGMDMFGLKRNPCKSLGTLIAEPKDKTFLTIDDVERIKNIAGVTEESRVLIDLLFWTGMRISEATALLKSDIHPTYISVVKHKVRTSNGYVSQKGVKNNKGRTVAIHNALYEELMTYADKLYGNSELFPRHYISYNARMKRLFRIAGLDASIHSFRHSHVAMLIHMGYSPKLIADRIGDTVSTMLNVYAHVYPEDIERLTDDLESICIKSVSYAP